jgi:hypothetical protein
MSKHGDFCWTEVASTDREGCKPFYEKVFGWEFQESANGGGEMVYLEHNLPGGMPQGALYQMAPEMYGDNPPPSHFMNYVTVDDCDATVAQATELGATINFGPYDIPNVGRMAAVADPTGAHFSIIKLSENYPDEAAGKNPPHGTICWYEHTSKDRAAAMDFYQKLFGWEFKISANPHTEYHYITANGQETGGVIQMDANWGDGWENIPAHWMTYIAVDNCDAACENIKANGGNVCVPAFDIPNTGRIAVVNDPAGANFSVIQLAKM